MAFGGEVQDGTGLVLRQEAGNQRVVANIAFYKDVPRIAVQRCQRFQVARVGQLVEVDDGLVGLGQPVKDKVGANKAGGTGDKNGHGITKNLQCYLTGTKQEWINIQPRNSF